MLLSMEEFRAFQPKKPTYALFGWPLGHTMSPELHAQLFEVFSVRRGVLTSVTAS